MCFFVKFIFTYKYLMTYLGNHSLPPSGHLSSASPQAAQLQLLPGHPVCSQLSRCQQTGVAEAEPGGE